VPHAIAIRGQCKVDMGRLCGDLTTVCETHMDFLDKPDNLDRYVFLLNVLGDGYGGLEHRWSSSLVCSRKDLPRRSDDSISVGYRKFLGLCSHEYFHLWNVKRMKPAVFSPYHLQDESHTGLLWVFEGITSYYDDLALRRSGLIDNASYLDLLGQTITKVLRGSGRFRQSVEESSYDAWTKFYKQEANAGNAIVSYYAKGSLIALALDLTLRDRTDNACTLDDVMRECWKRFGEGTGGMPERGLEAVASELCGEDLSDFFESYVRGTIDIPLELLLAKMGIGYHLRTALGRRDVGGGEGQPSQMPGSWLGCDLVTRAGQSVFSVVQADGPAEKAGLATGDIAVAMDNLKLTSANLATRLREHHSEDGVTITAFRRDELMRFRVTLEEPPMNTCYLTIADDDRHAERLRSWLGESSEADLQEV
jgi:predicted metalloprotease with PDZ domain